MPPTTWLAIEGNRIILRLGTGFRVARPCFAQEREARTAASADTTPPGVALTGLSSQTLGAARFMGVGLAGPSVAIPLVRCRMQSSASAFWTGTAPSAVRRIGYDFL